MMRFLFPMMLLTALLPCGAQAIDLATGFSANPDYLAGAAEAARQAAEELGDAQAKLVIVYDSYTQVPKGGGPNRYLALEQMLDAVREAFPESRHPGLVLAGQHDHVGAYDPYTDKGAVAGGGMNAATGGGIAILAVGGDVRVRTAFVDGCDSDSWGASRQYANRDVGLAKGKELAEKLSATPLPGDGYLLVLLGTLHGGGDVFMEGFTGVLGDTLACVGGASSNVGWVGLGDVIYQDGQIIPQAVQAILIEGDFGVSFAMDNPEAARTDGAAAAADRFGETAAGEADTAARAVAALPQGSQPKGLLLFNCRSRADNVGPPGYGSSQQDREKHLAAVQEVIGTTLPLWGHYSGLEIGKPCADAAIVAAGRRCAAALIYETPDE